MSNSIPSQSLYALLDQEEILIEHMDLKKLDGFYYQMPECRFIGIRNSIAEDTAKYRSILAEEIGHHFTNPTNNQPTRYLTPRGRIELEKSESAALRWAADFLIPENLLLEYLSEHKTTDLDEISESFVVMKYLVKRKFLTMSRKRMSYALKNGSHLILSNMPSIYIYDPINSFEN